MNKNVLILSDWFYPAYKAGGPITSLTNLVKCIEDKVNVTILTSALTWLIVREDYRNYLNQGSGLQEVTISMSQRLDYLAKLINTIDFGNLAGGIKFSVDRTSYSDFLAQVMDRVPAYTSYENGDLFLNTIKHVFMPRLFFPQKKSLDDSEVTNIYTGRMYSGAAQGVSIGIGYMAYYYLILVSI